MAKLTQQQCVEVIDEIMRHVTLRNRQSVITKVQDLIETLGLDPKKHNYYLKNVAYWPSPKGTDAFMYQVDFNHGEQPDGRLYLATLHDVMQLLGMKENSVRVAISLGRGEINRVDRPTKLGPCIIHKLLAPVSCEEAKARGAIPVLLKSASMTKADKFRVKRGAK